MTHEQLAMVEKAVTGGVPPERMSGPDQIWVCTGCGRTHEGDRYDMPDTSCVMWARLCRKEKVDGEWVLAAPEDAGA